MDAGVAGGRLGRAWLGADHAEVADELRRGGIAEIEDLQPAVGGPSLGLQVGDQVGDAGVALPPVLVRAVEPLGEDGDLLGSGGIGDVPDIVAEVAVGAQQVDLAGLAPRQLVAGAGLDHLRAAIRTDGSHLEQMVGERAPRVRHVDDREAIGLHLAGQRIERRAVMMADIGDPPIALLWTIG